jgi:hypothetical protein
MPYKSDAQRKYFHYLESKGKMPKSTVDEWDEASRGMDLPEHKRKKMHLGGSIDYEEGGRVGSMQSDRGANTYGDHGRYPKGASMASGGFVAMAGQGFDRPHRERPDGADQEWDSGEPHVGYPNYKEMISKKPKHYGDANRYAMGGMVGHDSEGDEQSRKYPYDVESHRQAAVHDEHRGGYAYGGQIDDEDDGLTWDEETGNPPHRNSSGEPHTDDDLEEEYPMEYMAAEGGMVSTPRDYPSFKSYPLQNKKKLDDKGSFYTQKKMNRGGMVDHGFAKALKKKMYG